MTPATSLDPTYGEGYDVGRADGIAEGRAQARGNLVRDLLTLAAQCERSASTVASPKRRDEWAAKAKEYRNVVDMMRAGQL